MIGAIIGDIIGSAYEFNPVKTKDFELFTPKTTFTDDTVLTVAVADHLLHNTGYIQVYKDYPRKYVRRGYGGKFYIWANTDQTEPYNSFGNGSAMRVSPVGWAFDTLEETLLKAKESAEPTHNHPEGIKGAQAVAAAIYLARNDSSKVEIQKYLEDKFGYKLSLSVDEIRSKAYFDETCPVSVPEALICFLQSSSYEDALRNAVSLGADADTQAAIAGSIAEAFYKEIPESIFLKCRRLIHDDLWTIINKFHSQHINLHHKHINQSYNSKIRVINADITTLKVDVIVNAANKTILGGGGVDGAIHRAAGEELYKECLKIRETKYPDGVPTGEAVITNGYNLPAKYVIHTPGPIWEGGDSGESDLLYNCYYNSLKLAANNDCKSIAFPAISTGAYGYPKNKAEKVAVQAISDFLEDYPDTLDEIILVTC